MKPGQAVTHHHSGGRNLGHLDLTDNFQWAFTQHDDRGRRVTEIELPQLSTNWKHFLDNDILEIGELPEISEVHRRKNKNQGDSGEKQNIEIEEDW